MAETLDIPEGIRMAFDQMMHEAPQDLREDNQFRRSTLLFLKIGGPRLARQHIDVKTRAFCDVFDLGKKRVDVPTGEDTAEENTEEENTE